MSCHLLWGIFGGHEMRIGCKLSKEFPPPHDSRHNQSTDLTCVFCLFCCSFFLTQGTCQTIFRYVSRWSRLRSELTLDKRALDPGPHTWGKTLQCIEIQPIWQVTWQYSCMEGKLDLEMIDAVIVDKLVEVEVGVEVGGKIVENDAIPIIRTNKAFVGEMGYHWENLPTPKICLLVLWWKKSHHTSMHHIAICHMLYELCHKSGP